MRTYTITDETNDLDIHVLHSALINALNPIGTHDNIVQIVSCSELNIYKEREFSDISIEGEAYAELEKIGKSRGLTVAQMLDRMRVE